MLEKYLGFPPKTHHYIYIFATIVIAISLPLSVFGLSLGIIILGANWIVEGNYNLKFLKIVQSKSLLCIISIYLIFILGLLWSENFQYAIHDLKIKLPLFGLPVIFATIKPFNWKEIRIVLILFVIAVITGTFISFAIYMGATGERISDTRNISIFISHIRFALMINLAVVILSYAVFKFNPKKWQLLLIITSILWLLFFLFILNSYTGFLVLTIVLPFVLLYLIHEKTTGYIYKTSIVVFAIISIIILLLSGFYIKRFNTTHILTLEELPIKTVNGNRYKHKPERPQLENGYQIWINICEKELRHEWNKISSFPYDSLDQKEQALRHTLVRYLTSKGLTKDSLGIAQLNTDDIRQIEMGHANYLFGKKFSVYAKVYPILWQWKSYKWNNNPSGHSVTMRIEYFKTGLHIIKRYPFIGTGTGDVDDQFKLQYKLDNSKLGLYYQKRSHNQILTFFVAYGAIGGFLICIAFLLALYFERQSLGFLFFSFILIAFLSMLNEDTLETHSGVSFIAFFFSFLLYNNAYRKSEKSVT